QLPDDLLSQSLTADAVTPTHGPEYLITRDPSRRIPRVDCHLYPGWHRGCADASVFSYQIDNAPATIPLLQMRERQRRRFRAPQSAAEQNSENRAIAQPL